MSMFGIEQKRKESLFFFHRLNIDNIFPKEIIFLELQKMMGSITNQKSDQVITRLKLSMRRTLLENFNGGDISHNFQKCI